MSLFPEPSVADQVASVDHLRKDAKEKIKMAARARDQRAVEYWAAEAERLKRLRGQVVNAAQVSLF